MLEQYMDMHSPLSLAFHCHNLPLLFSPSGVTSTPLGGAVSCTQVKILEQPFRSLRTLSAQPSKLEIGALSSSMSDAPPSS